MISQIGKYRILGELGRGGMGRVYRAYDPDVNRHVAIKVLEAEADPELLRRFKAEIDTTGSLQHRNIVTAFECGEDSGVPYLVMELLAGQTLEKIIKDNLPLLLLDKVRIMNEVAHGLSFAHSRGVIHRDVKPGNIMRLPDGTVKIMDFGIARVATRKTVMTQEGFIFGTVPYMAPEQFEPGGKADQQTDIFSYADVYYELLTGKQPFAVPNEIYPTIRRIKTLEPEGVSQFVPGCPEGLELLVHRAMAKDREVRYETFAELLLDHEAVLLDLERELAAQILDEVRPVLEAGDLERAEALLAKVLKLDPGSRDGRELWRHLRSRTDEHRFSGRIAELLLTSETQIASRQFAEAVQTLETALRIRKHDEKVRTKLAEANEKLASQLAANKVVAEVRKLLQKAALPDALERVHHALKLDPQHTDALSLKPRIEAELERRQEEELERGIQKSHAYLKQKNFVEALSALPVTFKEPARERIAQLRATIEQQKIEHDREIRAQRFNLGVSKLQESLGNQDTGKAAEQISFLREHFGDVPGAPAALAKLQAQLDSLARSIPIEAARRQAKQFAEVRNYAQALEELDSALQRFPDELTLADLRREIQAEFDAQRRAQAIAKALEQVRSLLHAGKVRQAGDALAEHRRRIGDDAVFAEIVEELGRRLEEERYREALAALLERSRGLVAQGRLAESIAALEAAPEFATEVDILALLSSARSSLAREQEQARIDSALQDARRAERDGDPGRALTILTHAVGAFPHAQALTRALDELRAGIEARRLEQRRSEYQSAIRKSIDKRDWTEAQLQIQRARSEFPDERIFDAFAEKVEGALHDLHMEQLAGEVRGKLAANRLADVSEDMTRTAVLFASDPRWQLLEKEVSLRKAYEAGLAEAASLLARKEIDGAEARLNALIPSGAPDDRAARLLADVGAARLAEAKEEIARFASEVCGLLQRDAVDQARSVLAEGKAKYPDDRTWIALETEISARKAFLDGLERASQDYQRGDFESADRWLRTLQTTQPADAERVRTLARAVAGGMERKAREESLEHVARFASEIRGLLQRDAVDQARSVLAEGKAKYPDDETWIVLESEISARKAFLDGLEQASRDCQRGDFESADRWLRTLQTTQPADAERVRTLARAVAEGIERKAREDSREHVARFASEIRGLLLRDAVDQARSVLAEGQAKYPDEQTWIVLESEISARKAFLDGLEQASRDCQRGDFESADRWLRSLQTTQPADAERVRTLARAVAEGIKRKAQEDSLAAATRKLVALKKAADLGALTSFLETMRRELPDQAELQRECQLAITELKRRRDAEQREAERQKAELARKQKAAAKPVPLPVEPVKPVPAPVVDRAPVAAPKAASKMPWLVGAAGVAVVLVAPVLYWRSLPGPQPPAPSMPSLASVRVTSEPAGASVSLRNETCTAPCTLKVPTGSHTLSARLDGYESGEQTVVINQDNLQSGAAVRVELRTIPAPPPPEPPTSVAGKVEISVNQDDANVLVDGQRYGVAGLRKPLIVSLETGDHKVRVEKIHHTSADLSVRVVAGETKRVSVDLRPLPGRLSISGALPDVQVAVDGAPRGKTSGSGSLTLDVPPGTRVVRLTRDAYVPREEVVQVGPNQTVLLSRNQVELTKAISDRQISVRLEYARVPNDADRLEEFAEKFKGTQEAAEARKRADSLREQARKDQAAKEEAARTQAKDQAAKEQAAKDQALRERRDREGKDKRAILDVLARYRAAYAGKDAEALRSVWTNVPGGTLDGIRKAFRAYRSITVDLQPTGDPAITEDTARITCRRTVTNVGGPNHPPDVITFRLQRSGAGWVISGIE